MTRRDDLDVLYGKSKKLECICKVLFWSNSVLSIMTLFGSGGLETICVMLQLIIAMLYLFIKSIDDGIIWYKAEKMRRKANVQSAFKLTFSEYNTEGYYNNELGPSLYKYAVNTFESNYFSKELAGRMLSGSCVKAVVSMIAFIITAWFVADGDVLLIVVQSVFSAYILEETIILAFYKTRMDKLFEECFAELITVGITTNEQEVWLLAYIVEYEAVKAHYKVRLSSSLFAKMNEMLSNKWNDIQKMIKISSWER